MMNSNPGLYRKLSEPFPSKEAANEALRKFNEELSALREKYRLADVHVLVQINAITESGEEGIFNSEMGFGDQRLVGTMLAMSLGREQARRESEIATLLKLARKGGV